VVVSGADIWLGDQFLGTVLACDFRSDLKQAGIGRGYCSFRFVTPVSIPAASLRLLTVTRITDGSALQMTSHLRSLLSDRFSPLEAGLSALHPQSDLALVTSCKRILCGTTAGLAPGHLRGFIDSVENDRTSGWAQDVSYPELPVLLDIWLYDQLLGTILACAYRGDLDAAGIGRGCCSFSFATQLAVPSASLRYLTIRRRADGATLQMTPGLRTKAA
jgi:predicted outer membrane lipoprotein